MIDLHYWTTPNGNKITLFLEETGLAYRLIPVNLQNDEQLKPDFLQIAPNNKIPAIVDHDPADGGPSVSLFESGAILQYLADKTGELIPSDPRARLEVNQWLFWQVAGLGPMAGQTVFFTRRAEKVPAVIDRFVAETSRLFRVLNARLADREYLVETYSIADIASYPWVAHHNILGQDLDDYPHIERWLDRIAARPATERAYVLARRISPAAPDRPASRQKFASRIGGAKT